jgi:hypothetical protein
MAKGVALQPELVVSCLYAHLGQSSQVQPVTAALEKLHNFGLLSYSGKGKLSPPEDRRHADTFLCQFKTQTSRLTAPGGARSLLLHFLDAGFDGLPIWAVWHLSQILFVQSNRPASIALKSVAECCIVK